MVLIQIKIYGLLLLILSISACTAQQITTSTTTITATSTTAQADGHDVSFTTDDNLTIFAKYWHRGTEKKIILLHMLGRDSSNWEEFAENLPYTTIAIDLRGHGQSDGDWQSFQDADFNNMILDVKAANEFTGGETVVIGASIGANVALNYADNYDADGIALLSPSYDYRGVDTRAAIARYKGALLIVSSRDDEQSYNPSISMHNLSPSDKKQLKTYDDAGHGTDMLDKEDLDDLILQWIDSI